LNNEILKNNLKKKHKKKDQSQLLLTFKTHDHDVGTNHVEGKPKNNIAKLSVKKSWGKKLDKKAKKIFN